MKIDYATQIRARAKQGAAEGLAMDLACPWPYDSEEGRYYKAEFIMHRAALVALGLDDKPLTPD